VPGLGTPRRGVYTTNGGVLCLVKRSLPDRILPDLYCFAMLGRFAGYYPGYSREIPAHLNALTWAILKAHTENRAGRVRLRSADPRETPFRYFDEGNDESGLDLASVVEGIKFVRKLTAPLKARGLIAEEELPGAELQSDEALREYVEYQAWGHHASCVARRPIAGRRRRADLDRSGGVPDEPREAGFLGRLAIHSSPEGRDRERPKGLRGSLARSIPGRAGCGSTPGHTPLSPPASPPDRGRSRGRTGTAPVV
jgi:hypothetical protein